MPYDTPTTTTKASTPNNPALWAKAIAQAKRKFDAHPSAYANGWAAKWYKANGGTWSAKKDLRNWFNEKWVNIARPIRENGEIVGFEPCGRSDGEGGYPKCMPLQKAMRLSDAQRKTLIQRKRRGGLPQDGAPTMTSSATLKHLPSKHDQSGHGRKGPAGSASRGAYTAARAAGSSHREALDAGKRASGEVRQVEQQQRNVSRAAQLRERANRLSPQAETATPAKPLAQQDGGLGLTGTPTKAYGVDPNTSYRMTHRIVEMDDLIPSNTRGGGVNPQYDAELQPRDRRRSSSQAQIDKIARGLNPEVMTEDFKRIDAGSPIIDARGMVLSGNGRTLALQRHEDGSAYPGKQSEYRDEVLRVAKDLGIDPAEVAKMKNPVVVRQLEPNVDPVAFAREANSSGTLRMSPIEQARVDAEAMPQSAIAKLKSEDGQTLDAALRSPANKEFINAFLKVVPDNERASLLTADGELNPVGLYRAKAAVYTATFQSDSGDRMARSLLDSLDPDLASVQAGLSGALPQLSATVSTTRTSNPALDPSNDIATAVDTLARIRGNPGLSGVPAKDKVRVYLEQSDMFNEAQKHNLSDAQVELLIHIDSIASRPARVRDYVQDIARMIDAQPAEGQGGFFGGPLSLGEIYTSATQASRERGKRTEEAKPKKPDESNTTAPSEPKPKLQLGDAIPKRSRGGTPKPATTTPTTPPSIIRAGGTVSELTRKRDQTRQRETDARARLAKIKAQNKKGLASDNSLLLAQQDYEREQTSRKKLDADIKQLDATTTKSYAVLVSRLQRI